MNNIYSGDWCPKDIDSLEPNAWSALKHQGSTSVIAGPGAGKTEFLAQKAIYLLETGACPANQHILAISFKTDAAKNLAERIKTRCPEELHSRFTSMTFDAFTKSILDRFRLALPEQWRPTKTYDIEFLKPREVSAYFNRVKQQHGNAIKLNHAINQLSPNTFESKFIGSSRLGLEWNDSAWKCLYESWIRERLYRGENTPSQLTFMTINRLAEYIIRTNSHVRLALKATYPFVFIDEFQDTTYGQYDFLLSAFGNSSTVITAVGDYKQRIMGWAGARTDAFSRFDTDFSAARYPLYLNHRSSPELIRIQRVIAGSIEQANNTNIPLRTEEESAWICRTKSIAEESQYFANWIASDMSIRDLRPCDYAILVRQTPDDYEALLAQQLMLQGIGLRNESKMIAGVSLQDLLSEDLTVLFLSLLRLSIETHSPNSWSELSSKIYNLRNINNDDEKAIRAVGNKLSSFIFELKNNISSSLDQYVADSVFELIISYLDIKDLKSTYSRYGTGDLLDVVLKSLKQYFIQCVESSITWKNCLDELDGRNHISLMTIHKSKGLEFNTVIFLGLDDSAWWSHSPGSIESISTFFVAFSRAKERVVCSFCSERGGRHKVQDIYALLSSAGVNEYEV